MRSTLAVAALLACSSTVLAAPLQKREIGVADIFNYALTLEHLEATFYAQGLQKYSADTFSKAGYPDWVRRRVSEIGSHEATHVKFLTSALKAAGATPVAACTYSFPDTDPASFLAVAQVLEGVGTSAYLGAAQNITSPAYLEAAGSILAVEARHSAWIRSAANKGDAFPNAFETPLYYSEVYSLAAPFIKSCPKSNPSLPVTKFPTLTLTTGGTLQPGQTVKFSYANAKSTDYVVFITGDGQFPVQYSSNGVKLPAGEYGQLYAVITSSKTTANDDTVKAGPAIVEVPLSPSTTFPIASST